MKFKILFLTVFIGESLFAQSPIDNSISNRNYYEHFQNIKGNSINWLRPSDAVPIIIDELLKKGIAYYTIGVGELIKINETTRLVVTVSFRKADKEYGFLYEPTHGLPIDPKDRDFLTQKNNIPFVQAEKGAKGDVSFSKIEALPDNIFLLKQRCYWFQFDNNGTKYDVPKEVAQTILRLDIDDYLKRL